MIFSLCLLTAFLMGCPRSVVTYRWKDFGIEFDYPHELHVVERYPEDNNQLFIFDENLVPQTEGGSPWHLLTLIVEEGATLEESIADFQNYTDVTIGNVFVQERPWTKVTYTFPMDQVLDTVYLTELDTGGVLIFYTGKTSFSQTEFDQKTSETILNSLNL